jgi:hypothetical protein
MKTNSDAFTIDNRQWRWRSDQENSQNWGKTHILVEKGRKYAMSKKTYVTIDRKSVAGDFKILIQVIDRVKSCGKNSAWWLKGKTDQTERKNQLLGELKYYLMGWNETWILIFGVPKDREVGSQFKDLQSFEFEDFQLWTTIFWGSSRGL